MSRGVRSKPAHGAGTTRRSLAPVVSAAAMTTGTTAAVAGTAGLRPLAAVPRVSENRFGAVRQRLCAAGVSSGGPRGAPRLADRAATHGRHRCRAVHSRPDLHRGDLRGLPVGRNNRGAGGHGGDLPARIFLRGHQRSVGAASTGRRPRQGRSWTASTWRPSR
jgi:hypothetical protein